MRAINASLLGLLLLITSTAAQETTIGLETAEASRGVTVPLNECHDIDEEEVSTLFIAKECRVFTGMMCTGRHVLLQPGEHTSEFPVPIGSVLCGEQKLF